MSLYKQNTNITRTFITSAHYCTLLGKMCEVMILHKTCKACYYCGKSLLSSLFIFKLTHYKSLLLFLFITFFFFFYFNDPLLSCLSCYYLLSYQCLSVKLVLFSGVTDCCVCNTGTYMAFKSI